MKIKSQNKPYVELYGFTGKFETPKSSFVIKYFSTFANNEDSNHKNLLDELKPMRERVATGDLNDLNSLLQRDLDDLRVATSLVPYLQNKISGKEEDPYHIAFFPAILTVLIPKGYLKNELEDYPRPKKDQDDNDILGTVYEVDKEGDPDDFWTLEQFKDEEQKPTSLGKLKIDFSNTEAIVLDGQHRANAFRVITGSFFENSANSAYEPFYQKVKIDKNYHSDLPVTIIWFETISDDKNIKIDPRYISRELFIAVNNNARSISKSRLILLDDKNPSALITKFYYNRIAQEFSFKTDENKISLLHLGFDVNKDLRKHNPHVFTLTEPEIICEVVDWVFFGSRTYTNDLSRYKVSRNMARKDLAQLAYFLPESRRFVDLSLDDYSGEGEQKIVKGNADLDSFEKEFNKVCYPIFQKLIEEFEFLKPHFEATTKIDTFRRKQWSSSIRNSAWDEIFKGGEGLYYSIINLNKKWEKGRDLKEAALEIENIFREQRALGFKDITKEKIDEAFKSFSTKAFQIGYFMAFIHFMETLYDVQRVDEALREFIIRVNTKIKPKQWVWILTELRQELIKSVDPKSWPAYTKIILRFIQKENEFFAKKMEHVSPEAKLLENYVIERCKTHCRQKGLDYREQTYEYFVEEGLESWVKEDLSRVESIFSGADFKILEFDSFSVVQQGLMSELKRNSDE